MRFDSDIGDYLLTLKIKKNNLYMKKFIKGVKAILPSVSVIGVKSLIPTVLVFKKYVTLQVWSVEIVLFSWD